MHRIAPLLLLALALPASAQIYKYTDANGNTVFTNQPPGGVQSEEVKIQQPNTVKVAPSKPLDTTTGDADEQGMKAYERLELADIPDDEALRANNGTFSVTVVMEPALRQGHAVRLNLDGQPYDDPSAAATRQLTNIDRGEHQLSVEVVDAQGQVIQASAPQTFTVQRVNVNTSPALRPPPPKPPIQPKPAPAPPVNTPVPAR